MSKNEGQVSLQGVDGNDEEVGQRQEVQGERDVSDHGHNVAWGGEKCKRTRRAVADVVSTKEIEEALGGFSVAGPSTWPDPVAQVLDWRLGEVIAAIDCNTRELA